MPIQSLTTASNAAFMKLGNIRKGDANGKNGAPRDLDHFRVTFMPGGKQKLLEDAFRAVYGPTPVEINVRTPYNEIHKFWDANYEGYQKGGMIAQAGTNENGAYWIFYRSPETAEVLVRNGQPVGAEGRKFYDNTPCDPDQPLYYTGNNEPVYMKPTGRMQLVIPELANIEVGYFEFRPTSPRDIRTISAELDAFDAVAKSYGKGLAGIPFKLIRREEEVTKKIKGKLVRGPSWVVHITTGGEWGIKALEAVERLALPDVIDAEAEDVDEFDGDPYFGEVEEIPQTITANVAVVEASQDKSPIIDVLDAASVNIAAKYWNVEKKDAAISIGKMLSAKRITRQMNEAEFRKAIGG